MLASESSYRWLMIFINSLELENSNLGSNNSIRWFFFSSSKLRFTGCGNSIVWSHPIKGIFSKQFLNYPEVPSNQQNNFVSPLQNNFRSLNKPRRTWLISFARNAKCIRFFERFNDDVPKIREKNCLPLTMMVFWCTKNIVCVVLLRKWLIRYIHTLCNCDLIFDKIMVTNTQHQLEAL